MSQRNNAKWKVCFHSNGRVGSLPASFESREAAETCAHEATIHSDILHWALPAPAQRAVEMANFKGRREKAVSDD